MADPPRVRQGYSNDGNNNNTRAVVAKRGVRLADLIGRQSGDESEE